MQFFAAFESAVLKNISLCAVFARTCRGFADSESGAAVQGMWIYELRDDRLWDSAVTSLDFILCQGENRLVQSSFTLDINLIILDQYLEISSVFSPSGGQEIVRAGELAGAEWSEIDLEKAEWRSNWRVA